MLIQIRDLRFSDKYDYVYDILPVLSSARAWTTVILTGKRDSIRQSTTSLARM